MNRAEQIAKKHELWWHIKRLGDYYGEDAEITKEYGKSIYEANLEVLNDTIQCFLKLVQQSEKLGGVTYNGKCRN